MTVPGRCNLLPIASRFSDEAIIGAEPSRCRNRAGVHFGGRTVCREPALNPETIACCANRYRVIPGALTPTEIVQHGAPALTWSKYFRGRDGRASYIKSLKAPLPQIELVPTGGVTLALPPASSKPAPGARSRRRSRGYQGDSFRTSGESHRGCSRLHRSGTNGSRRYQKKRCLEMRNEGHVVT